MDTITNFPQGYWAVNDKKYINKHKALLAAKNVHEVTYNYFNDIWQNFDRSNLGTRSLNDLYKARAVQLREEYDYLILYFSGGADSYNVLRTFLDNNIRLDEVCVKWSVDVLNSNSKIYDPNTLNDTSFNYLSEWDYAILPVLNYLKQYHPEIKIEIVNWTEDLNLQNAEFYFNLVNHWHDIEIPSLSVFSPNEEKLIEKGKLVGAIYGIDKPLTYFENNHAYMAFLDSTICIGTPNPINIFGTEYFYYTPKFPSLTFEMAYVAAKWLQSDKKRFENYGYFKENKKVGRTNRYSEQQRILRNVLYSTWTNAFQVSKPEHFLRFDKQNWIVNNSQLCSYVKEFNYTLQNYLTSVSNTLVAYPYNGKDRFYKQIYSKKYLLY